MSTTACNTTFFKAIVLLFERFSCQCFSLRRLALVPALVFLSAFSLPALALTDDYIQRAYIAFFNRPADAEGFNYWRNHTGTEQDLLDLFAQSDEYRSDFANKSNREIIAIVYQNLFGREPETEGWDYWEAQMNAGWVTISNAAYAILGGAQGTDLTTINNKTTAAQNFTASLDTPDEIDAYAKAGVNGVGNLAKDWLATVSYTSDSLDAALYNGNSVLNALIQANHSNSGSASGSIAACFSANSRVNYAVTSTGAPADDIIRRTVEPTTYNGEAVMGVTDFYSTRNPDYSIGYYGIANGIVYHRAQVYDSGEVLTYASDDLVTALLDMQPSQYFDQRYAQNMSSWFILPERERRTTFVGYETIVLAGKTFSNVCRFHSHDFQVNFISSYVDQELWFAPGYGLIKMTTETSLLGNGSYQYDGDL